MRTQAPRPLTNIANFWASVGVDEAGSTSEHDSTIDERVEIGKRFLEWSLRSGISAQLRHGPSVEIKEEGGRKGTRLSPESYATPEPVPRN